ncbi:MAG: phosphatidate cytidylyltransferase [Bacteroidota bacterium]|nr:phosphatidate cytidylyltransferase [Bacteroidota bacterium]MDQ6890379.1 phosphatidate cytidylyltransferase [Bacteroidota bacterium]
MAFDSQTFKTRSTTATVFVIIMLTGLFLSSWSFIILFIIIHFGCWYEFVRLIKKIKPSTWGYFVPFGLAYITVPLILLVLLGFPSINSILFQEEYQHAWQYSPILPFGIIFSIWINDTMAYLVGSLIGKTPLSKISPKKTWEGTIGGVVLCVLTISLVGEATGYYSLELWIIIASCCAVFGTLGDLLESKLKRLAKVKDSGTLMPGHGGFLDRFDSLLIASLAVGLYYFFL